MAQLRKYVSLTGILVLIALALFGRLIYMNVRPADPLPYGFVEYTPAAFVEAQQAGKPIFVDVYASWCPTCMAQHEALEDLLRDPRYSEVVAFRVDYEGDEDFVRAHRVPLQSTILIFRGVRETSRSVGETDANRIRAQLETALDA